MAKVSFYNRLIQGENGSIAVPLAVIFPVLLGMIGLAVEYGSWEAKRTELQNLVDSAAYSAAIDLVQGASITKVESTLNTITGQDLGATAYGTFDYAIPPSSGSFIGRDGYIQVTISKEIPRFLSKIFDDRPLIISTRAVASFGSWSTTTACALALSESADSGIKIGGNAEAYFSGCSLATNSTSINSFLMKGGSVKVEAGCIDTVGGAQYTSNLTLLDCPTPRTLQRKTPDPYEDLEIPNVAAIVDCESGGIMSDQALTMGNGNALPYGYKCFSSSVSLKGNITLAPGIYIIKNGGLTINGGAVVSGVGVTILLANDSSLSVNGRAQLNLTSPSSGPFSGIIFAGERTGSSVTHSLNGNSDSFIDGAFYFPKDEIELSGSTNASTNCVQYISSTLLISGNASMEVGCTPTYGKTIFTNILIALRE